MKKITKELQKSTVKELDKEIAKERIEIAKINLKKMVSPEKDTNTAFKKRKRLAVLLTVRSQKQDQEKVKV